MIDPNNFHRIAWGDEIQVYNIDQATGAQALEEIRDLAGAPRAVPAEIKGNAPDQVAAARPKVQPVQEQSA
jgi:hypothetical protein